MTNVDNTACMGKINDISLNDIEMVSIEHLPTLAKYGYQVLVAKKRPYLLTHEECECVKLAFLCNSAEQIARKLNIDAKTVANNIYSVAAKLHVQTGETFHRDIFYQIFLKGLDQLGGATHG